VQPFFELRGFEQSRDEPQGVGSLAAVAGLHSQAQHDLLSDREFDRQNGVQPD
jgi:hypothetical protein